MVALANRGRAAKPPLEEMRAEIVGTTWRWAKAEAR
jgi:hypothetical protein